MAHAMLISSVHVLSWCARGFRASACPDDLCPIRPQRCSRGSRLRLGCPPRCCSVSAAAACVKSDFAALALFVPEDGTLRIVSTHGYPQAIVEHIRLEPGEGVIGRVFASRRRFFAGAGPRAELFPSRLRYRTGSCIVIPLLSNGRTVAVLSVADPSEGDHFAREDILALERLAPVA